MLKTNFIDVYQQYFRLHEKICVWRGDTGLTRGSGPARRGVGRPRASRLGPGRLRGDYLLRRRVRERVDERELHSRLRSQDEGGVSGN